MILDIIKFKTIGSKKTREKLGRTSYPELNKNPEFEGQEDIRFCLFRMDTNRKYYSHTLLIDIDDLGLDQGDDILDHITEVFGEYTFYQVFTGKGHHVYIPLVKEFTKDDVAIYKKSYFKKCDELAKLLPNGCTVDTQVFSASHYGRVPGSINSKNGARVSLLYYQDDEPVCPGLDAILDESEPDIPKDSPLVEQIERSKHSDEDATMYRPDLYCNFVNYYKSKGSELTHDLWKKIVITLAKVGKKDLAKDISKQHKSFNEEEFELFYERAKTQYNVSCGSVFKELENCPVNHCMTCPHNGEGGSPAFVSGNLPTPSAKNGFHPIKVTKEGPELNTKNIVPNDIARHIINICGWRQHNDSIYGWNKTHWKKLGRMSRASNLRLFTFEMIEKTPLVSSALSVTNVNLVYGFLEEMFTKLPEVNKNGLDPERYINFINGVYDLETEELLDHSKDLEQLAIPYTVFDREAKYSKFQAFLDEAVPDKHAQEVVQSFFGLAISNVSPTTYQKMLWIEGAGGRGKSTLLNILKAVVGKENTCTTSAMSMGLREDGLQVDFENKKLFYIDDFASDTKAQLKRWNRLLRPFISGEVIKYKELFEKPVDVDTKCTVVVTSHEPPPVLSATDGMNRRSRAIDMNFIPKTINDNLAQEIVDEELPGVVQWALDGLKKFKTSGGLPAETGAEKAERDLVIMEAREPIEEFLASYVEITDNSYDHLELRGLYDSFIRLMDIPQANVSIRLFSSRIRTLMAGLLGVNKASLRLEKNSKRYVRFCKMRSKN